MSERGEGDKDENRNRQGEMDNGAVGLGSERRVERKGKALRNY